MFTRCPDCHAIYPLRASWLAQDRGKVKCGRCGKIYNALDVLFDDWPEPDEEPAEALETTTPFYLSHRSEVTTGIDPSETDEAAADPRQQELLPARNFNWLWNALLWLLIPLTLLNFAWHYSDQLLEIPLIRDTATGLGLVETRPVASRRAPEKFQLLSRDMHPHPSRPGAWVINLTLANRADFRQPLPDIEISMLDENRNVLAWRLLKPREYLPADSNDNLQLAADALLPLLIEIADPGVAARGFEIRFL